MVVFVLVHGGFHGGWCWGRVADRLAQRGFVVRAPDLAGMGEDATPAAEVTLDRWVSDVGRVIAEESSPVILVGHSLGGFVVSALAEAQTDHIAASVYLSAALGKSGETIADVAAWMNPKQTALQAAPLEMSPDNFAVRLGESADIGNIFYNCCDDDTIAFCRLRLGWQPLLPMTESITLTEGKFGRNPRVYIECLRDLGAPLELQRELQAIHCFERVYALDTDHSPFFSAVDQLTSLLEDIAARYSR